MKVNITEYTETSKAPDHRVVYDAIRMHREWFDERIHIPVDRDGVKP